MAKSESPTKRSRRPPIDRTLVRIKWDDPLEALREDEDVDVGEFQVTEQGFLLNEESFWASNNATIYYDDEKIGHAMLQLYDRDIHGNRRNFMSCCDAESGDLQAMAVRFFDKDGRTPRLRALKALPDAGNGGLLYVKTWKVETDKNDDTRWSDLATLALKMVLTSPELAGAWNLAIYIPEPDVSRFSPAEACAKDKVRFAWRGGDVSEEERTLASEAIDRGIRLDTTPFLRCGFFQIDELLQHQQTPYYVATYAEVARSGALSHAAATAMKLEKPEAPAAPPSGKHKELLDLVVSYGHDPSATIEPRIRSLVSEGASVVEADALHCMCDVALTNRGHGQDGNLSYVPPQQAADLRVIDVLFELGAQVNAKDKLNGATPLQIIATKYDPKSNHKTVYLLIRKLIDRGADVAIADKKHRTPRGTLYLRLANTNDFLTSFGMPPLQQYQANTNIILNLLTPPGNPPMSDADRDARNRYDASARPPQRGFLDDDDDDDDY